MKFLLPGEVGIQRDSLEALKRKAGELDDYMAAQRELSERHYDMMDSIRHPDEGPFSRVYAEGWLRYETDFGEALLKVMADR
jgi:hypothetical protein